MRYFPKSSINILEASLGEFVYKHNNKPYIGIYIETDEGKYYSGSDIVNLGPELKKPISSPLKFGNSKLVKKNLQRGKFLNGTKIRVVTSASHATIDGGLRGGAAAGRRLARVGVRARAAAAPAPQLGPAPRRRRSVGTGPRG